MDQIQKRIWRGLLMCGVCTSLSATTAFAQDPHFSQFYASPMTLNPANTGFFYGDMRMSSTYRNQWQSVSTPFTTTTAAAEFSLFGLFNNTKRPGIFERPADCFGFGIMGMSDMSNNRGLKSSYLSMSLAYNKALVTDGDQVMQMLGVGFQSTFVTKRVDYNRFTFSRQFTPTGFDASLSNGEPINGFSLRYIDYSTGIIYSGMNDKSQWNLGASYYHFTRPNESISGEEHKLDPRYTVHGRINFQLTDATALYLSGLYMKSALAEEFTTGAVFELWLPDVEYRSNLFAGVYVRPGDAIIPQMGMKMDKLHVGLSYDVNVSRLKTGSQGRGGFELSISFFTDEINEGCKPYHPNKPYPKF